jgi:hypothetical protein
VTSAEHQDVVQAFSTDRTDPPLRNGVRLRSADGCPHHRESFRPEDLVEGAGELRVSIPEKDGPALEGTIVGERACCVTTPSPARLVVPATRTRLLKSSMKNMTYRVFRNPVST